MYMPPQAVGKMGTDFTTQRHQPENKSVHPLQIDRRAKVLETKDGQVSVLKTQK